MAFASRTSRAITLFLCLIIASVIAVYMGTNGDFGYFNHPRSFLEGKVSEHDSVAIGGLIVPGSIVRLSQSTNFEIRNRTQCGEIPIEKCAIPVILNISLPEEFVEGDLVIARGVFDGSRVLAASVEAIKALSYGEHTFYVWVSYAVTMVVFGLLVIVPISNKEKLIKKIADQVTREMGTSSMTAGQE